MKPSTRSAQERLSLSSQLTSPQETSFRVPALFRESPRKKAIFTVGRKSPKSHQLDRPASRNLRTVRAMAVKKKGMASPHRIAERSGWRAPRLNTEFTTEGRM